MQEEVHFENKFYSKKKNDVAIELMKTSKYSCTNIKKFILRFNFKQRFDFLKSIVQIAKFSFELNNSF